MQCLEDVYIAYCPELPGCVTYGKTEEDARRNIREAIELYLRPSEEKVPKDAKFSRLQYNGTETTA